MRLTTRCPRRDALQYLQDVSSPFGEAERQEALDWLLGLAVRYEYGDNGTGTGGASPMARGNLRSS